MPRTWPCIGLSVLVAAPLVAHADPVDLRRIGHFAPKGRVQDLEYNPDCPVVKALIALGPDAIRFLVSKLEDRTVIKEPVEDYWPVMRVGDLAWILLVDLFTKADWQGTTLPEVFDGLVPAGDPNQTAYANWNDFISKVGRKAFREEVDRRFRTCGKPLAWDPAERCFKVAR